jgi:hypothetical protein
VRLRNGRTSLRGSQENFLGKDLWWIFQEVDELCKIDKFCRWWELDHAEPFPCRICKYIYIYINIIHIQIYIYIYTYDK